MGLSCACQTPKTQQNQSPHRRFIITVQTLCNTACRSVTDTPRGVAARRDRRRLQENDVSSRLRGPQKMVSLRDGGLGSNARPGDFGRACEARRRTGGWRGFNTAPSASQGTRASAPAPGLAPQQGAGIRAERPELRIKTAERGAGKRHILLLNAAISSAPSELKCREQSTGDIHRVNEKP